MRYKVCYLFLCAMCLCVNSYRYLLVFTVASPSLTYIGAAYARILVDAGHEVVFITSFPVKHPPKERFKQIDVSSIVPFVTGGIMLNITDILNTPNIKNDVIGLQQFGVTESILTLKHESVQELLNDGTQKFDAVIADLYESELLAGLSVVYNCPMMWSYSIGADASCLKLIDTLPNPSYIADYLSNNDVPFTMWQRIEEFYNQLESLFVKEFYMRPQELEAYNAIIRPILAKQNRELPDYEEMVYNASFIFGNVHFAAKNLPHLPRNYAPIGGIHIKEPVKPLPKSLQELFDNSLNGVIYFSLGTNWKSSTMPPKLVRDLLDMFGKFKQTVVWKFEVDLPNKPSNVHTVQYAPQHSILAHKNLKLFITHGGLLSATEAIHFGVPLITVPVYFDQAKNANKAVKGGYGLKVDVAYDMAGKLGEAVETVIRDSRFKEKALEVSKIYHDRLVHPEKEFLHWAEHVVKTKGARHLRSPAFHVAWYQRTYLDVVLVILGFMTAFYFFICKNIKSKQKKSFVGRAKKNK